MTQLKTVCNDLQMSQVEAPEVPPSFEIFRNVRDHYRNKLRISQQELLDRLETLRRRKVEELQQFVSRSDIDQELKKKLNDVVESLDGLIEMLRENRARNSEMIRRTEVLKSHLNDSIFALNRLNIANTAMVALKKMEREVSQGYDKFMEPYNHLQSYLRSSILKLESSMDSTGSKEAWLVATEDYLASIGDILSIQILDLDSGYYRGDCDGFYRGTFQETLFRETFPSRERAVLEM